MKPDPDGDVGKTEIKEPEKKDDSSKIPKMSSHRKQRKIKPQSSDETDSTIELFDLTQDNDNTATEDYKYPPEGLAIQVPRYKYRTIDDLKKGTSNYHIYLLTYYWYYYNERQRIYI